MNFVNLFTSLIIILILIFTYLSIQKIKKIYIIKTADVASIKESTSINNLVIISGTVRQYENILHSPIYNKECLSYKYMIYRNTTLYLQKIGIKWKLIEKGFKSCDFIVEDKSGTAYINVHNAKFSLNNKIEEIFDGIDIPQIIKENSNLSLNLDNIKQKLKFKENILKSGENIYLIGKFKSNDNETTSINTKSVYVFNENPKNIITKLYFVFLLYSNIVLILILLIFLI